MLAVLIDPEGIDEENLNRIIIQSNEAHVDLFLIGGSMVSTKPASYIIESIKSLSRIPCLIFPGQIKQLDDRADALMLLSLISGRNAEYLIGKHVEAAPTIKSSGIEVIPTGYMLIDGGSNSSVQYISQTIPIPSEKSEIAVCTALAGEMLGMKLIYLEAGSGARHAVSPELIRSVKEKISLPLIVGGGIKTAEQARRSAEAGADIIVIGNAIQNSGADIFDFSASVHSLNESVKR